MNLPHKRVLRHHLRLFSAAILLNVVCVGDRALGYLAPPEERFVGVLDFRPVEYGGPPGEGLVTALKIYAEPDVNAAVVAAGGEPVMMEIGYEENGVVVFERRPGGWSLVRVRREAGAPSSGWVLDAQSQGRFIALEDFLKSGMASAAGDWDGRLYAKPDGAELDGANRPERRDLRVLGGRWIGRGLWIEIEILSHNTCEDPSEPKVFARGWMPAFGPNGRLNIEVATRGC